MIILKSAEEIALMKKAGEVVRDTLNLLQEHVKEGVTTEALDRMAYEYIRKCGAKPSFLGYNGFPASICASVNEEVVHGIPSKRVLREGDIVSIDVGAVLRGYQGDAARTYPVGKISAVNEKLIRVCEESFFKGVEQFQEGARLGDISHAIQSHVEQNGFGVVRDLVGHGIGREMHEDPSVPNFGRAGRGVRLSKGLVLAIEPMISVGDYRVYVLDDNWTIVTADGKPAAHYENTVALTDNGILYTTL
ncbi:MAG: type I methionyl aminopeptidase [Clostridia bacterium]|nr:type I methionyl aminopeptidase [Clostridia bacterium]